MISIKELYERCKLSYNQQYITEYTEYIEECMKNSPYQYITNLEYIITSSIGLSTLKEFVKLNGLPLSEIDNTKALIEECIHKCEVFGKDTRQYKEALSFIDGYKDKYANCYNMSEAYANDNKDYLRIYYGKNKDGIKNNRNYMGMISAFGEQCIPDMLISAQNNHDANKLINMIISESVLYNPTLSQWLLECSNDINIDDNTLKILNESSLEYAVMKINEKDQRLLRESILLDNEDTVYEYTEEDLNIINDLIKFKEYKMTTVDDPSGLYKEIVSLYEKLDGVKFKDDMSSYLESSDDKFVKEAVNKLIRTANDIKKDLRKKVKLNVKDSNRGVNIFSKYRTGPVGNVIVALGDSKGKFGFLMPNSIIARGKAKKSIEREINKNTGSKYFKDLFYHILIEIEVRCTIDKKVREKCGSIVYDSIKEVLKPYIDNGLISLTKDVNELSYSKEPMLKNNSIRSIEEYTSVHYYLSYDVPAYINKEYILNGYEVESYDEFIDNIISIFNESTGVNDAITEAQWMVNTRNKKTGDIPEYLRRNHNMSYGEDDGKSSLKDYKRPSADKPESDDDDSIDYDEPDDDDEEDDDTSSSSGSTNNYYYYTYTNSLNKNSNSFNKDNSTHDNHSRRTDDHSHHNDNSRKQTDDHSRDKRIHSDNLSYSNMDDDIEDEEESVGCYESFSEFYEELCECMSEILGQENINESNNVFERFTKAYKAAWDYDTGHALKITYSLDQVEVTDVGIAKPLKDELLSIVKDVETTVNDKKHFPMLFGIIKAVDGMMHAKKNIELRKSALVDVLNNYIENIGYVDFQAKNCQVIEIYDRYTKEVISEPVNIVGVYAAADLNTERSLCLSAYNLQRMRKRVSSRHSNFNISSLQVGDIQKTPTFMTTYWDDNADRNLVNHNGEVIANDGMDRDNISNIITSREAIGYDKGIKDVKYTDAFGDFVQPIQNIAMHKKHKDFDRYARKDSNELIGQQRKLNANLNMLYGMLSDIASDPTKNNDEINNDLDNIRNIIDEEHKRYNLSMKLLNNKEYEAIFNNLKGLVDRSTLKQYSNLSQQMSDKYGIDTVAFESVMFESSYKDSKKETPVPRKIQDRINKYNDIEKKLKCKIPTSIKFAFGLKAPLLLNYGSSDIEMDFLAPGQICNEANRINSAITDKSSTQQKPVVPIVAIGNGDHYVITKTNKIRYYSHDSKVALVDDKSIRQCDDPEKFFFVDSPDVRFDKSKKKTIYIGTSVMNESTLPWELSTINEDMVKYLSEAAGDADDNKPESDHPIKDTFTDIDRTLTKHQQSVKKKVQDIHNVGRAALKPIKRTSNLVQNALANWKDADETNIKERMADPHARNKLFDAISASIKYGSFAKAGLLYNPVFLFLTATNKFSKNKKMARLRNEMIGEIKAELEIIDEKIKDAASNGDNKSKYQLMRLKNELTKKLVRVGGNKKWRKAL